MKVYRSLTTIGAPGAPKAMAGDLVELDARDATALLAIGAIEKVRAATSGPQPTPEPTSEPTPAPAAAKPQRAPRTAKPPKAPAKSD